MRSRIKYDADLLRDNCILAVTAEVVCFRVYSSKSNQAILNVAEILQWRHKRKEKGRAFGRSEIRFWEISISYWFHWHLQHAKGGTLVCKKLPCTEGWVDAQLIPSFSSLYSTGKFHLLTLDTFYHLFFFNHSVF